MTVKIVQSSHFEGQDWWSWAVWLEASGNELDAIDSVVYRLHSTFHDPVRTIRTRENGFRLDSGGWGEFVLYIEILGTDGSKQKRRHPLKLEYPRVAGNTKRTGRAAVKPPPGPRAPPKPLEEPPEFKKIELKAPRIFISSGAADAFIARKVRDGLAHRGVAVSTIADMTATDDWETSVKNAIRESDAAVFVVSGSPGMSSVFEMQIASGGKNPSIPLLVGTATQVPSALADHQAVHLDSEKDFDGALDQILGAANVKL